MYRNYIEQRRGEIYKFISLNDFVVVRSIEKALNLSSSTVRRDIKAIEKKGLIKSYHGGVHAAANNGSFIERRSKCEKEKILIGKAAAKLVENGDTIYIGGGSTTYEFALSLNKRSDIFDITIVTSAWNIASCLLDNINIKKILLGGELVRVDESMTSKETLSFLEKFNFDKSFIGTGAVSAKNGYTMPKSDLSDIKKIAIANSRVIILLCDHTKLGERGNYNICPMTKINYLITDYAPEKDQELEAIKECGTNIIIACEE